MPAGQCLPPRAWPVFGVPFSRRCSWVFSRLLSWQPEGTVSCLCSIFGEKYLLLQASLYHPTCVPLYWWTEIQTGLMRQSKPLDWMPCALSYPKGMGKALGTGSVSRINNWKINLSFPCHKLKAYRPYNMSIIEVSGYWWRSQSSLSRAHLCYTI